MKTALSMLLTAAAISLVGCGQSKNTSMNERYPAPWREEFNLPISKTLASKQVHGCGQFKYRESSRDRGEFLVHCTRDGTNWVAYLVWDGTGAVTGPHTVDPTLN